MIVHYLGNRTAHIDVDPGIRPALHLSRYIGEDLRVCPKKLKRHRPFFLPCLHERSCISVFVEDSLGADHLRISRPTALFPAQKAERHVSYSGHGRQDQRAVQLHISYL